MTLFPSKKILIKPYLNFEMNKNNYIWPQFLKIDLALVCENIVQVDLDGYSSYGHINIFNLFAYCNKSKKNNLNFTKKHLSSFWLL